MAANPNAYCVGCKQTLPMTSPSPFTMKNGASALKGSCPGCGASTFKITGAPPKAPSPAQVAPTIARNPLPFGMAGKISNKAAWRPGRNAAGTAPGVGNTWTPKKVA